MRGRKPITRGFAATLLAVMLPAATVGQDPPRSILFDEALLQDTVWQLSQYAVDGELVDMPGDVSATLQLVDGAATGTGGCNQFSTEYELIEHLISFDEGIVSTEIFCEGASDVESAYLALLPTMVAWSITDGALTMVDPSEMPTLVFGDGTLPIAVSQLLGMQREIADQADTIEQLELRISNLEAGGGDDPPAATRPTAPRPRGNVQRQFAELGEDPERGDVRWIDRADDEDGYRVFARRIQCVREDGEIRERPSPWVRVDVLPANAQRYRPRHDEMNAVIEPQSRPIYGRGLLYEVGVSAFNEAGRSRPVVVGAYFTAPEYGCP